MALYSYIESSFGGVDVDVFYKLFDETKDFTDCLDLAIYKLDRCHDILLFDLISVTKDFRDCLLCALKFKNYNRDLIIHLIYKTKDFKGCLQTALLYGLRDVEVLELLILATKDMGNSLLLAIRNRHDQKVIDEIFFKTSNFDQCLSSSLTYIHDRKQFVRWFIKYYPNNIEGVLLDYLKSRNFDNDICNDLIDKTVKFDGCLIAAISNHNVQCICNLALRCVLCRLRCKNTDFRGCLKAAIEHKPKDSYLFKSIYPLTRDVAGCYELAITNGVETDCIFLLHNKMNSFDGYLKLVLEKRPKDVKLFDFLFQQTRDYSNMLRIAMINDASPYILFKLLNTVDNLAGYFRLALENITFNKELLRYLMYRTRQFRGMFAIAANRFYLEEQKEFLHELFTRDPDRDWMHVLKEEKMNIFVTKLNEPIKSYSLF